MEQLAKYVDSAISTMSKPKDMIPFLKQRIFQSFHAVTANKILDHCEFIVINSAEIGVRVNSISLSDKEKTMIKSCVYAIYGKNINIVAIQHPKKTETDTSSDKASASTNLTWLKVREQLVNRHGEALIKSWFDPTTISYKSNKLSITGRSFSMEQIKGQFDSTLDSIAKKEHLIIELRYNHATRMKKGESEMLETFPVERISPERLAILQSQKIWDKK